MVLSLLLFPSSLNCCLPDLGPRLVEHAYQQTEQQVEHEESHHGHGLLVLYIEPWGLHLSTAHH